MRRMGLLFRRSVRAQLAVAAALLAVLVASVPVHVVRAQAAPVAQNAQSATGPARLSRPAPDDKGDTYYALESQARRWTTKYTDAIVISERSVGGAIRSRVTDLAGNEVASMDADVSDGRARAIRFRGADSRRTDAIVSGSGRATLDWGNQQAYGLWKDLRADQPATLDWKDGVGRPRGAALRNFEREMIQMHTEWPGNFAATVSRRDGLRHNQLTKQEFRGHALAGQLQKDDVEIGVSAWFEEEKVFSWSLRGVTDGYVDAKRLEPVGGWPFTPDAAWVNVQNFAFYQFHTAVKTNGSVAQLRGWLPKFASALVPSLQANEPGCDYLHWLDNTVFRPCCDLHDRCYSKYGCDQSSWWQVWSGWTCSGCNAVVIFCFATNPTTGFYPFGIW
jgi:hypothetical protein